MSYNISNRINFSLFSKEELSTLHGATLETLNRTGVSIQNEEARNLLKKAGANVNGDIVRIPSHLVEWALRTAPKKIILYDRNGDPRLRLGCGNSYFSVGQGPPFIIDLYSGKRRDVLKQDVINTTKILDYLPNVDFIKSLASISDCPPIMQSIYEFECQIFNTVKPIVSWAHTAGGYSYIIEMASTVSGSLKELQEKPFIAFYSEPMPPLQHTEECLQKVLLLAEKNIPQTHATGMVMGTSAPVTPAGALVVANAEQLSALLIVQLKREGAPYIYGADILAFDWSSTIASYGAPEFMLTNIGVTELSHYYGLPIMGHAGSTDSQSCDSQAGLEIGYSILLAALCGTDLAHNLGFLEFALTGSYELLLICDEYLGEVKRIKSGIEINDNSLALDEINKVGPGGEFISSEHTLKNFRNNWFPGIIPRENNYNWIKGGKLTLTDRANKKAREILESYEPEQLSKSAQQEIKNIMKKAESDLA
jgi:trimethylamine--corrinoid protein Co-methyltransferase